jgi:hypothetical protein
MLSMLSSGQVVLCTVSERDGLRTLGSVYLYRYCNHIYFCPSTWFCPSTLAVYGLTHRLMLGLFLLLCVDHHAIELELACYDWHCVKPVQMYDGVN